MCGAGLGVGQWGHRVDLQGAALVQPFRDLVQHISDALHALYDLHKGCHVHGGGGGHTALPEGGSWGLCHPPRATPGHRARTSSGNTSSMDRVRRMSLSICRMAGRYLRSGGGAAGQSCFIE